MCFGLKKKEKILFELYKDSIEKLEIQLLNYLNDNYKSNFELIENIKYNKYNMYIYDNIINTKIKIKTEIIKNSFNYKMIIYDIEEI